MSASEAISQVFYRYALGVDEDDFDLFATCFSEDACFETASQPRIEGREAICDYFRARRQVRRSRGEQSRHLITNVVLLEESSAEAIAVAYVTGLIATGPHSFDFHCGWYRDRLVKSAGRQWQISQHFIHADGSDPANAILPLGFRFRPDAVAPVDGP
jgi:3-phenylpropionate/cinnamic acid dioxygenase small subunit